MTQRFSYDWPADPPYDEDGFPATHRAAIKDALADLRKQGFYAKQNHECCGSCGWAAIPRDKVNGPVLFYHKQANRAWEPPDNAGGYKAPPSGMLRHTLDFNWGGPPDKDCPTCHGAGGTHLFKNTDPRHDPAPPETLGEQRDIWLHGADKFQTCPDCEDHSPHWTGERIKSAFEKQGLTVDWNGTLDNTIGITPDPIKKPTTKTAATQEDDEEEDEDDDITIHRFDHGPGQGNDTAHSEIHQQEHTSGLSDWAHGKFLGPDYQRLQKAVSQGWVGIDGIKDGDWQIECRGPGCTFQDREWWEPSSIKDTKDHITDIAGRVVRHLDESHTGQFPSPRPDLEHTGGLADWLRNRKYREKPGFPNGPIRHPGDPHGIPEPPEPDDHSVSDRIYDKSVKAMGSEPCHDCHGRAGDQECMTCNDTGIDPFPNAGKGFAQRQARNDDERNQWIDNDEGLYDWHRGSGMSRRDFIKQHRSDIDLAIDRVTSGDQPAHYLKYGPGGDEELRRYFGRVTVVGHDGQTRTSAKLAQDGGGGAGGAGGSGGGDAGGGSGVSGGGGDASGGGSSPGLSSGTVSGPTTCDDCGHFNASHIGTQCSGETACRCPGFIPVGYGYHKKKKHEHETELNWQPQERAGFKISAEYDPYKESPRTGYVDISKYEPVAARWNSDPGYDSGASALGIHLVWDHNDDDPNWFGSGMDDHHDYLHENRGPWGHHHDHGVPKATSEFDPRIGAYDKELDIRYNHSLDPRGRDPMNENLEESDIEQIKYKRDHPDEYAVCPDCHGTRYLHHGMTGCGICGGLGYVERNPDYVWRGNSTAKLAWGYGVPKEKGGDSDENTSKLTRCVKRKVKEGLDHKQAVKDCKEALGLAQDKEVDSSKWASVKVMSALPPIGERDTEELRQHLRDRQHWHSNWAIDDRSYVEPKDYGNDGYPDPLWRAHQTAHDMGLDGSYDDAGEYDYHEHEGDEGIEPKTSQAKGMMSGSGCGRCGEPGHTSERCPSNKGSNMMDSSGPDRYLSYDDVQPKEAAMDQAQEWETDYDEELAATLREAGLNLYDAAAPKKRRPKPKDDDDSAVPKGLKKALEKADDLTKEDANRNGQAAPHPPKKGQAGTSIHDLADNVGSGEHSVPVTFITDHHGEVAPGVEPAKCRVCSEPMNDHAMWNPTHQNKASTEQLGWMDSFEDNRHKQFGE